MGIAAPLLATLWISFCSQPVQTLPIVLFVLATWLSGLITALNVQVYERAVEKGLRERGVVNRLSWAKLPVAEPGALSLCPPFLLWSASCSFLKCDILFEDAETPCTRTQ